MFDFPYGFSETRKFTVEQNKLWNGSEFRCTIIYSIQHQAMLIDRFFHQAINPIWIGTNIALCGWFGKSRVEEKRNWFEFETFSWAQLLSLKHRYKEKAWSLGKIYFELFTPLQIFAPMVIKKTMVFTTRKLFIAGARWWRSQSKLFGSPTLTSFNNL